MNEQFFLKGQRVISPRGKGEVLDAVGDDIIVQLDNGETETFPAGQLLDDSNAG